MTIEQDSPTLRYVQTVPSDHFLTPLQLIEKITTFGKPIITGPDFEVRSLPASHPHTNYAVNDAHLVHWPINTNDETPSYLHKKDLTLKRKVLESFEQTTIPLTISEFPHALFYMMLGHAEKVPPKADEAYIQGGTQSLKPPHIHQIKYGLLDGSAPNILTMNPGSPGYDAMLATQSNLGPQHAIDLINSQLYKFGSAINIVLRLGIDHPISMNQKVFGFDSFLEAFISADTLVHSQWLTSNWQKIRQAVSGYKSPKIHKAISHLVHQIPTAFILRPSDNLQDQLEASRKKPFWVLPFTYSFSMLEQPGGISVLRDQSNTRPS